MSARKAFRMRPDYHIPRADGITPEFLAGAGIEGLILDLDNTLTRWEEIEAARGIAEWVSVMKTAGVRMVILSNGLHGKQEHVSAELQIPLISAPFPKPFAIGFRIALKKLGLPPEKAAMVGDIVFTDIFGANLLGIKTILVDPLSRIDFPGTKVWRLLEAVFKLRHPHHKHPENG
jgi:HAD superfamily phosphatase (TIGR01668 family)